MSSLGVLVVTSSTGEPNPIPYFSAEDRADIEQWARALGWRVEVRVTAEAEPVLDRAAA